MGENRRKLTGAHRWLIAFCLVVAGVSASPNGTYEELNKEYKPVWLTPRSTEELMAEKYAENDGIIEAVPSEHGYRFMIVPSRLHHAFKKSKRLTLRLHFHIVGHTYGNRVYVEVIEINNSHLGIPFNKFRYNNLMPMGPDNVTRPIDIPISQEFMKNWLSKPFSQIGFILKFEFGMLSNVKKVTSKIPVLIFSQVPAPKCSEFTCCLNSNVHEIAGPIYYNLVVPTGVLNQRCIDCLRVSEVGPAKMDNFNMIIHEQLQENEVPFPSQIGRCRATEYTSLPVIYTTTRGKDFHILQREVPYFTPQVCQCVEDDDVVEDYEDIENEMDHKARQAVLEQKPKKKASRHLP